MTTFAINTDNEIPLKSVRVALFAEDSRFDSNMISISEVVRNTYKHPQAPNDAVISVLETRIIKTVKRNTFEAAPLELYRLVTQTVELTIEK